MSSRTAINSVFRSLSKIYNYKKLFDFTTKKFVFSEFYNLNLDEFNRKFDELFPENNFKFVRFYITDQNSFSFFKKSLFIFALKLSYNIKHGMPSFDIGETTPSIINYDNGKLNSPSINCMNTVFSYNGNNKFLKLVPIDSSSDCIIFDIINGIIFNIILTYSYGYRKHLASYEYSFLSYYKNINTKPIWLYEELINVENTNSPYNISCLSLIDNYEKAYVVVSEAKNHIGLGKLFSSTLHDDHSDINNIYIKYILETGFIYFFSFLIDLKTKYGFEHNDLHGNNIIYDIDNNSLILIDFGRSVFSKYTIDNIDDNHLRDLSKLNNNLTCEIEKLDLKNNGYYSSLFSDNSINSYNELIERCISDNKQSYFIIKDESIIFSSGLFELLSLCLLFYINFMSYFNRSTNTLIKEAVTELKAYFNKIIFIHTGFNFKINAESITILYKNYRYIKENYINKILQADEHPFNLYRNTLALLLDGLFILALLLFINGIKQNEQNNLFTCIIYANGTWNFRDLEHKKELIDNFISKLAEDDNRLYKILKKHNFFVFNLIKSDLLFQSSLGGGKKTNKTNKTKKNKKGGVNMISSEPSEITASEITASKKIDEKTIDTEIIDTEQEEEILQISEKDLNDSYTKLLDRDIKYSDNLKKLNECYKITYFNIEKEKEREIEKEKYKTQPTIDVYNITVEELNELEELPVEDENELSSIIDTYIKELNMSNEEKIVPGGFNKKKYIRKLKRY